MIRPFMSLVLTLAASIAAPSASIAADIAKGGQLARQWCANCHVVDGSGAATVQQGPPSFRSIGLTAEQLRTFLTQVGQRESVSRGKPSGGAVFSYDFSSGSAAHAGVIDSPSGMARLTA